MQAAVPVALLSPNKAAGSEKSSAMMVMMRMMQGARRLMSGSFGVNVQNGQMLVEDEATDVPQQ